jgi:2-(1,2-epoxy-1,2-dihydrophenyl)acetyl-CoA isomerase
MLVEHARRLLHRRPSSRDTALSDYHRTGRGILRAGGGFMHALRVERADGVVTLTLDRPERRNAIDVSTWQALAAELSAIGARPADRAVVLTGAGGTFCAGGDLSGATSETGADPESARRAMSESVGVACLALHTLPKPVIAAVEGTAAGAGANLAFGCDLVVAGASARFGEVFIHRALSVDSGGSWLLPRLVGLHRAKELVFLGDWIGADDALRFGLVNRVVADAAALAEAQGLARRLAAASPAALARSKRALDAAFERSFEAALDDEADAIAECVASPDFAAAMRRFLSRA